MAKKKIGYIELRWTCPKCGTVNPGPVKLCTGCGAGQPVDVKFEQANRQELITDEAAKAKAQAGADIHCPYCGTRNPADAKVCVQCGGDLVEGIKREQGRVLGAFTTGPATMVKCPRCGTENPDTSLVCSQCGGSLKLAEVEAKVPLSTPAVPRKTPAWVYAAIGAVVILVCGVIGYLIFLSQRTEAIVGTVEQVSWERSIPIEALVPVEYSTWQDQIPQGAQVGSCEDQVRTVQDDPAPNAVEVCGTPYTVDTGQGYGEVVQDCEYQVYDLMCMYTVEEWSQVDAITMSGNNFSPTWPEAALQPDQRMGQERSESYTIVFRSGEVNYNYTTSDFNLFQQAQVGSEWTLNVNSFGNLISIDH